MMAIPIRPQKKHWIQREITFTRYRIYNYRKYYPKEKRRALGGKCLDIYDRGYKLKFHFFTYHILPEKPQILQSNNYSLVIKNGKFFLYKYGNFGVKCMNPRAAQLIENLCRTTPNKTYPIYQKRIFRVLKNFARRHGVPYQTIKQSNKRPWLLLKYMLYPASLFLDDITKRNNEAIIPLTALYRQDDYRKIIKGCFGFAGSKLCNKIYSTIKAVGQTKVLGLGLITKGLLPLDYYYGFLDEMVTNTFLPINFMFQRDVKPFRNLLSQYPKERIKILLNPIQHVFSYHAIDAVRIWETYGSQLTLPEKPKSFQELHDVLCTQSKKINEKNYSFEIDDKIKKLDGVKVDGLRIEVPKDRYQLIDYSAKMNNCISTYAHRMAAKSILLLGIYKDKDLIYNVSVCNKNIEQFKGKFNSEPDRADYLKICEYLQKEKILVHSEDDEIPF